MNLDKQKILSFLRDNKEYLKTEFDVQEIKLFGSYVRGKQTDKSDIDLMVKFGTPSYDKLFSLKEWLEKKLGKECDIVRIRKNIRRKFMDRVDKELLNV